MTKLEQAAAQIFELMIAAMGTPDLGPGPALGAALEACYLMHTGKKWSAEMPTSEIYEWGRKLAEDPQFCTFMCEPERVN